ncbi:sensor histidine kinase [Coralloluteibacterium stylophorae]
MAETALSRQAIEPGESRLRRELYFSTLYRVLEAGLFVFLAYSPLAWSLVGTLRTPWLAHVASAIYLAVAAWLVLASRGERVHLARQAGLGLAFDILAIAAAIHTMGGLESAAALMLMLNVGAGALLMPLRAGLVFALVAALAVAGQYVYGFATNPEFDRPLIETVMFTVMYLAIAVFCRLLGGQMREAEALARRRGEDVANLAEINELILRRMRTGVLVVDAAHLVRVANEAGWSALGHPPAGERGLGEIAPELSRRLWHWRNQKKTGDGAVVLADDAPEVIPRFAHLRLEGEDLFLVFLDDASLLSRRAEEMTLRALGRLSASIAHEIRNPLASISYATQLLEESENMVEADRRLLEIVYKQCQRLNGIVSNVLGLARRERAQPEQIDLVAFVQRFVADYRAAHPQEAAFLQARSEVGHLDAQADPRQLEQAVTSLVSNAVTYGHLPGEAPRVTVAVRADAAGTPLLEVIDRGPGIAIAVVQRLFEPFYTTSEHGTGLGLYLARELCEANQCQLDYEAVAGGGSCFRIQLPRHRALLA